jgi:hypothetical protein
MSATVSKAQPSIRGSVFCMLTPGGDKGYAM